MTVLPVFGALAADTGSVMMERRKLQNAVDAAWLAAATELPYTAAVKAKNIEREYARANGADPDGITNGDFFGNGVLSAIRDCHP
jgi:hypothetical protein